MAVHVRIGLGHWPVPVLENYLTSASILHMLVINMTFAFSVYCAGPLWVICLLVPVFRPSSASIHQQLAVTAIGWLLIVGFLTLDPTPFSAWLLD